MGSTVSTGQAEEGLVHLLLVLKLEPERLEGIDLPLTTREQLWLGSRAWNKYHVCDGQVPWQQVACVGHALAALSVGQGMET